MGWWPFSSSTPFNTPEGKGTHNEATVAPAKPGQVSEEPSSLPPSEATNSRSAVKSEIERRNPYRKLESHRDSGILLTWRAYQERLEPIVWPNGTSAWPAFGLSGLFLAAAAMPPSILPGSPPRLARVFFSGAFATSGVAIHSGDEWNGASIATWWSASHVLLSSIYKTYRRELAKKGVKLPPTKASPAAWALTAATIATGAAYGITL